MTKLYYLKLSLVMLWFLLTSLLGMFYSVLHWGSLETNPKYARFFSRGVLRILGIKLEIEGEEYLHSGQPAIYIANHQSGLDMATFGAIYPYRALIIGKKELLWVPVFGLFFAAAGNILINRQKKAHAWAGLATAVEQIRSRKISIWIFPEGTRNRGDGNLLPFKKGAFYLAMKANIPLIPLVSASLTPLVDRKKKKITPGTLKIRILPPIHPSSLDAFHSPSSPHSDDPLSLLAEKVRTQMQDAFRSL